MCSPPLALPGVTTAADQVRRRSAARSFLLLMPFIVGPHGGGNTGSSQVSPARAAPAKQPRPAGPKPRSEPRPTGGCIQPATAPLQRWVIRPHSAAEVVARKLEYRLTCPAIIASPRNPEIPVACAFCGACQGVDRQRLQAYSSEELPTPPRTNSRISSGTFVVTVAQTMSGSTAK